MHKYNNTALIKKYLAKKSAYIKTSSFFKKTVQFHFVQSASVY